jgi:hypothetical protein
MKVSPELEAHRQWLGQIGQVGLVVSPAVLVKHGVVIDRQRAVEVQTTLTELSSDDEHARVADPLAIFRAVLGWRDDFLAGTPDGPDLPDMLAVALPEHEDHLRPTYAIRDPERPDGWLLLVQTVDADDFDKAPAPDAQRTGWRASPHARLERLLRETAIPIGILINSISLRLVYAPKGESSGYLTARGATPSGVSRGKPQVSERRLDRARGTGTRGAVGARPRIPVRQRRCGAAAARAGAARGAP